MYRQVVTHNRRAAIVFLIDCSLSMMQQTRVGTLTCSKMEMAELMCNLMIDELVIRAERHGSVRNYYDIAALGYSNDGVVSLLPGNTDGFMPVDRLIEMMPMPKTILNHTVIEGKDVEIPITYHTWITPKAGGSSPMLEALAHTYMIVDRWCHNLDNRDSFPPIVIHITDGAGNDSNSAALIDMAERLMSTHTNDGNTLLFSVHLSSDTDGKEVIFPNNRRFMTDNRDIMLLFKMSSVIPKSLESSVAYLLNLNRRGPYRGIMSNYSPCDLISLLNTGTESANSIKHM